VSEAMTPDRMNAWISQRDFKSTASRGIALQRSVDVLNDAREHLSIHQILVKNR